MKIFILSIFLLISPKTFSSESIDNLINPPSVIFKDIWLNESNLQTVELAKLWLDDFDKENALEDEDREIFKPIIKNGILFDSSENIIDTTYSKGGKAIYVIFEDGSFYVQPKWEIGTFEHADLASGKKVLCAGTVEIINGYLKRISDYSVQYPPIHYYSLTKAIGFLKEKEIDFEEVIVMYKRDFHGEQK
jgi:hypothetical protein